MSGISGYYPSPSYGMGYGSGYGYGTGYPSPYDSNIYGTSGQIGSAVGTPASGDVNLVSSSTEAGGGHGAAPAEEEPKSKGGFFQGIWDGFKHAVSSLFTPEGFLMAAVGVAACIAFPVAAPLILGGLAVAGGSYMMYKGATTGDSHEAGEGFFTAAMGGLGMWGGYKAIGTGEAKTPTAADGTTGASETANAGKPSAWTRFKNRFSSKKDQPAPATATKPEEVSPAADGTPSLRNSAATKEKDEAIVRARTANTNTTGNAGEANLTSKDIKDIRLNIETSTKEAATLRGQAEDLNAEAAYLEGLKIEPSWIPRRSQADADSQMAANASKAQDLRASAAAKEEEAIKLDKEIEQNKAKLGQAKNEPNTIENYTRDLKAKINNLAAEDKAKTKELGDVKAKVDAQNTIIQQEKATGWTSLDAWKAPSGFETIGGKTSEQYIATAESELAKLRPQQKMLTESLTQLRAESKKAQQELDNAGALSPAQVKVQNLGAEDLHSSNLSFAERAALREKLFTELKSGTPEEQATRYAELTKSLNSRYLHPGEEAALRDGLVNELKTRGDLPPEAASVLREDLATHYSTRSDRLTSVEQTALHDVLVGKMGPGHLNSEEISAAEQAILRKDLVADLQSTKASVTHKAEARQALVEHYGTADLTPAEQAALRQVLMKELQSSKVSETDKAATREALVEHYKMGEFTTTAEQTALRNDLIKDMNSRKLTPQEKEAFQKELDPSKIIPKKETPADPKTKLSWGERSKQQRDEVKNRFKTFGGNIKEYGYNKDPKASKPRKIWNGTWETANQLRRPMWSLSSTGPLAGFGMPEQQA